jgi:hypothetical protein
MGLRPEAPAELHGPLSIQSMSPRLALGAGAQAILSDGSQYRATGDGESKHNIRRRRKMLSLKLPQMA